jgi:hypothetical protein
VSWEIKKPLESLKSPELLSKKLPPKVLDGFNLSVIHDRNEANKYINQWMLFLQPWWDKVSLWLNIGPEAREKFAQVVEEKIQKYESASIEKTLAEDKMNDAQRIAYSQLYISIKDDLIQSGKSEAEAWQIAGNFMKTNGLKAREIISKNDLSRDQKSVQLRVIRDTFLYQQKSPEANTIPDIDNSREWESVKATNWDASNELQKSSFDTSLEANLSKIDEAKEQYVAAAVVVEEADREYREIATAYQQTLSDTQQEYAKSEQSSIPIPIESELTNHNFSSEWLATPERTSDFINSIGPWDSRWILFLDESGQPSPFIVTTLLDGRHAIKSPEGKIYILHNSIGIEMQKEIKLIQALIATPLLRRLVFMGSDNFDKFQTRLTQKYGWVDMDNPDNFQKYALTEVFQMLPDDSTNQDINNSLRTKINESKDPGHIDKLIRWFHTEEWKKILDSIRTGLRNSSIIQPPPSREFNPEILFSSMK